MKKTSIKLIDSNITLPCTLSSFLPYTTSIHFNQPYRSINSIESREPLSFSSRLNLSLKKNHTYTLSTFPFPFFKGKVKKRVSPFSTSLPKQQEERGRLMDSIYSSMLPFPSHKQDFTIKSKTSIELCNTFTLFALLASLEGWDEQRD